MKKWLKKNKSLVIGLLIGSSLGYLYYKFVGCASGTCAITSNPINSTIYGAIMGGLLGSINKKDNNGTAETK